MVEQQNGADEKLDVIAAIQAHVQWKQRLLSYIDGTSDEELDAEKVGSDCLCSLGQWIYGYGGRSFGEHVRFAELKTTHADFHLHAADVVRSVQRGENEEALNLLQKGEYPKVSNRIKSMLAKLSLEFDFS